MLIGERSIYGRLGVPAAHQNNITEAWLTSREFANFSSDRRLEGLIGIRSRRLNRIDDLCHTSIIQSARGLYKYHRRYVCAASFGVVTFSGCSKTPFRRSTSFPGSPTVPRPVSVLMPSREACVHSDDKCIGIDHSRIDFGLLGTLALKLLGFIGVTTMKMINRTKSTSIRGRNVDLGFLIIPPFQAVLMLDTVKREMFQEK